MNANARKRGPAIVTLVFAFVVFALANLPMTVPPVVAVFRAAAMVARMFM